MKVRIRLDGDLTEEIDVNNGLRKGCCMAPVMFHLYLCLVFEGCNEKVRNVDGVGIKMNYKYDQKIFRRYTRNTEIKTLSE